VSQLIEGLCELLRVRNAIAKTNLVQLGLQYELPINAFLVYEQSSVNDRRIQMVQIGRFDYQFQIVFFIYVMLIYLTWKKDMRENSKLPGNWPYCDWPLRKINWSKLITWSMCPSSKIHFSNFW